MALTRDFRETIVARVQRDPKFLEALFKGALNACLAGDSGVGRAILRDLVNATVGFEGLASRTGKPSKSLHRMLAPRGNPSIENFFDIVLVLQRETGIVLQVETNPSKRVGRAHSSIQEALLLEAVLGLADVRAGRVTPARETLAKYRARSRRAIVPKLPKVAHDKVTKFKRRGRA